MTLPAASVIRDQARALARTGGRPLHDVVLTGFDLETTGPDPAADWVVQIATLRIEGGGPMPRSWLVYPGGPIPPDASAVHKITDAHVTDAPLFAEIADDVVEEFAGVDVAVAYNGLRFDGPLLDRELAAAGRPPLDVPILDPFVFLSWSDRGVRPRTLGNFCRLAGVELANAHDATSDVRATLDLLMAMVRTRRIPIELEAALAAQRVLSAYIEAEFAHFGGRFYDRGEGLHVGFGKHSGTPVGEIPRDYARYLLKRNPTPDAAARWPEAAHEIIAKLA